MRVFNLLLGAAFGYYADQLGSNINHQSLNFKLKKLSAEGRSLNLPKLPEPNEKLQVFGLPMGHGDGTIIMCPKLPDGSGGEISIFDLGTIVTYFQWWDVAKLLKECRLI